MAKEWAFPFFGAGDASYFEWAEVHVYFARVPDAKAKKKIRAKVPPPLRDSVDWEGRELMVAAGQFAHMGMDEAYPLKGGKKTKRVVDDEGFDEDGDYAGDDRFFFAKPEQVDAFNADIESWLAHAHAISPIVAAFRHEDLESGGTKLSKWHAWSIGQLPSVLAAMKGVLGSKKDDHAEHMLRGILSYALKAKKKLTEAQRDWLEPERVIERAIENKDWKSLAYAKKDAALGDQLAEKAYELAMDEEWKPSIALFDLVLDNKKLELSAYCNALYAIQHDNNGLPVNDALARRFLVRCVPFAKKNPGILHNAACVYFEIGEDEKVLEMFKKAIAWKYDGIDAMRSEKLYKRLRPQIDALSVKSRSGRARSKR